MKKRALISVSDKEGIADFALGLVKLGYEIVSTGGTFSLLQQSGLDVKNVAEITGFPEILDGRVKTLHPAIHGGILARRDKSSHMETLKKLDIMSIDLVAVQLYPFQSVILKPETTYEQAIENIDIGGPAMIRAAAKNHESVVIVTDTADYDPVLDELTKGNVSLGTRKKLAAKAFSHVAAYDAKIAEYLCEEDFPHRLIMSFVKKQELRYGENPHQKAALYSELIPSDGIVTATQIHGKELSYNNIRDGDAALEIIREFEQATAVAVKHMNPCGVGVGETISEAYERAFESDPISIFGGIVALNREVDCVCAKRMQEIFLELIIAPDFTDEALRILMQKSNLRLIKADTSFKTCGKSVISVGGGLLIQERDMQGFEPNRLVVPTRKKPTEAELVMAKLAWTVVKHVKSNAIVVADNKMILGIGPGQSNRVGAARIALEQAGAAAKGAAMASDAFFPMPDTVQLAAKAGIAVIIQPGGSVKDDESIKVCDDNGIAMILTGVRHFKH